MTAYPECKERIMKTPFRILSAALLLLMLMMAGAQPLNVSLFDGRPPCQGIPCP